ncbi:MAG TPA: T9SS type A sorting domain-containing protein [Flavipsychrobacter sp.]|nr:T9SS type A sorting domain-containing protein [Flavipsychrobacter sp.]
MKKRFTVSIAFCVIFLFTVHTTHAQNFAWAAQNGTPNNFDDAKAIGVDGMGNVYVVGAFQDSVDLDPGLPDVKVYGSGLSDIYVQKLDPSGNFVWAFSIGSSTLDQPHDIHVEPSGDFYICGQMSGTVDFDPGVGTVLLTSAGSNDIFFAKYSTSGTLLFAKNMGGTDSDIGRSITADGSGNIYLGGQFETTADFDPGMTTANLTAVGFTDLFLAKYDASGNYLWAFSVGGGSFDGMQSIAISNSGDILATGYYDDSGVDFDPGAGSLALTSTGLSDIFAASYTPAGALNWAKSIGSINDDMGISLVTDASNNVFVTGYFQGVATDFDPGAGTYPITAAGYDIFILKLDASGNFSWAKQIGGPMNEAAYNMATNASGNLYITGYFNGIPDFDPDAGVANLIAAGGMDIFIASYNSSGALNWVRGIGSSTTDAGQGICADAMGNVYTCGTFTSTADVNTDVVGSLYFTSLGAKDGFVHKIFGPTTEAKSIYPAHIVIFPSPANEVVNVRLDKEYASVDVILADITGRTVGKRTEQNSSFVQLDVAQLPSGTYILEVRTDAGTTITKLNKL